MSRPGLGIRAVVAALGVVTVLTGCSAGQLAQTAEQAPTVDGTAVNAGAIALRNITLEYPADNLYQKGDDARLQFVAVNQDPLVQDTLIEVSSDAATSVDAAPNGTQIPANGLVEFRADGPVITLMGLTQELRVGEYVPVTFTFEKAGGVTAMVTVANPLEEIDRGQPYDFGTTSIPTAP